MTDKRTTPDRRIADGRRSSDQEWRDAHALFARRLEEGDRRMDNQDQAIAENTTLTQETKALAQKTAINTDAIVVAFQNLTGFFRVLEGVGKLAKPVGYIVMLGTAALGFWTALKTGSFWK